MAAKDHWSGTGRLRGGRAGIKFFITALRVLGLRLTYALSVPPAVYFSFVSPDVPATMDYHRRVFGAVPWWKRRWLVLRHFFSFGQAIIDRTAILAGKTRHFSFSFDGEEHLRNAVAEGRGVLLLTAHVGNWGAAGQLLSRIGAPVTVTGFDRETPEIRALLNEASNAKFKLIPLTGSPMDAIPLVAALRRGEVVAMLGDRAYGSPATRIPFLGGLAAFPVGPYVMAASAGAPLVHVFNLRERGGHYRFFGFPPQRPQMPPHERRDEYLRECATRFARDLEGIVKRDPFQWYNFFPFWEESESLPLLPPREKRARERKAVTPTSSSLSSSLPVRPALDTLIPHRPPMQWIDTLKECTETTARAAVTFTAEHFAVTDGAVPETALIECVAQTVAAALGYRSQKSGQINRANNGMLAAVSGFKIHSRPPLHKPVLIDVRDVKRFGLLLLVEGVVTCEGQRIAEGELSLYA